MTPLSFYIIIVNLIFVMVRAELELHLNLQRPGPQCGFEGLRLLMLGPDHALI